jgi:transposase
MGRLVTAMDQQLETLPGGSVVLAAELLVSIGDVKRFATPDKLVRYAGIAPKEWSSAGKGTRTRSEHGRRSPHATFFHIAVARILVRVVWRMLKHKEPYQAVTQSGAA